MIRSLFTIVLSSFLFCLTGTTQKVPFTIECQLKDFKKKKAMVHIGWQEPWEKYEFLKIEMINGKFKATGVMSQPTLAHIRIITYNDSMKAEQQFPWDCDRMEFFLCSGKTTITGSDSLVSASFVSGCKENELYKRYSDALSPISEELDSINALWQTAYAKNDSCSIRSLGYLHSLALDKQYRLHQTTILQQPSSQLSVQLLNELVYRVQDRSRLHLVKELFNQLSPPLKLSPIAIAVKDRLDQKLYPIVGKRVHPSKVKDVNGKPGDIMQYKGKVILIDFWASWCYPCKKEFPDLIKLYEKYKDKGFEVIGISIDSKKDKWLEGIKVNKIIWPQFIDDGPAYGGPASREFRVQNVPAKFLVNKEGVIIARDLPLEQLEAKLISLLGDNKKE